MVFGVEERHCQFPGDKSLQLLILRCTLRTPFLNFAESCKANIASPLVHHHHLWHHLQTVEFGKVRTQEFHQMSRVLCIIFIIHKRQYQKTGKIVTFAYT